MQTQIVSAPQTITYHQPSAKNQLHWLDYWHPADAYQSLIDHIESQPSSRNERHTMRAYLSSIASFAQFIGASVTRHSGEDYTYNWQNAQMPTPAILTAYIAHELKRGLAPSSITRNLAPIRRWIKFIEEQQVIPQSGNDFVIIMEGQRQLRMASTIDNPRNDTTSNRPALEQHGERLQLYQVNQVFNSFTPGATDQPDISTLAGKRDLAILYIGITSGLRAAEIARITPSSIKRGTNCYEIRVRGKRNNGDPIGIDDTAHDLIQQYITTYNDRLPDDDPRRITDQTPIWQPLLANDRIVDLDTRNNKPGRGITARAISAIVKRRVSNALGQSITAHDMRRTCAYLMRAHGYEWETIRAQLRHKSIATTEKYVGRENDLSKSLLSQSITFDIPQSPPDRKLL